MTKAFPDKKTKTLTIRVCELLRDSLYDLAEEDEREASDYIRRALENHVLDARIADLPVVGNEIRAVQCDAKLGNGS